MEQLISFETAKLAKKVGFDWYVLTYYAKDVLKYVPINDINPPSHIHLDFNWDKYSKQYSAPTQSLLQKWLREVHNIHVKVDDFIDDITGIEWDFEIVVIGTDIDENGNYVPLISYSTDDPNRKFKIYEEALEQGLFEALKLIDNN
jgi:hypothetical protein